MGNVRIPIPSVEEKAGVALFCEDLTIGYPEKDVVRGIQLDIERGSHVAVLGDNGEGKTTFLRTLAGDLQLKGGTFRWGTGLKMGYYAQHVFSVLDPEDTVYAHLSREAASGVTSQDVLAMSGCFLFKGDDVEKKVKVLSGGERARLVLAGLLLSKSHVLLLDEPTNHLDFETVEALGRALKRFKGTVIFISHDRTFVNLVATSILEVKKGRILHYPGYYEDYVYHLEQVARGEEEDSSVGTAQTMSGGHIHAKEGTKEETRPKALKQDEQKSEILKIKKAMDKAERRMHHHTEERSKLLEEISRNPLHFSKERNARLKEIQIEIEKAEDEWCSLQSQYESMEAKRKLGQP
jgi:ATP-binding cassette subfamily F protein 3